MKQMSDNSKAVSDQLVYADYAAPLARARVPDSRNLMEAGQPHGNSRATDALTPAARETLRRLDASDVTPCCGARFVLLNSVRICASCKLTWPDEDLRDLRQ